VAQLTWDLADENQLLYNGQTRNRARWPIKLNFNQFDIAAYVSQSGTTSNLTTPAFLPGIGVAAAWSISWAKTGGLPGGDPSRPP